MADSKKFTVETVFKATDKTSAVVNRMQSKLARFSAKASMYLRRISRRASALSSAFTGVLKSGALIGAAAVGAVFLAVNKTAESMDALAKKTRAMQFPIEEFQEWRFAAEQSGVASEVFDKSLGKFTKTVGELKGGYGAMYTALKKTNKPLLKQLQETEDVDKAFELYLKTIENTPGAMNKAALATAGFGRAGSDMINLANAGSKELEKLRSQMRENGVVTAEQAAKAEVYNDMMNRTKRTVQGLMVDVLTPLMPILTDIADRARQWAVENRGVISDKLKNGLKWLVNNFTKIVDWLKKIGIGIVVFYTLTTAIKVATVSMNLFNAAMNIRLGPAKKAAAFMGGQMPASIGKSTAAVGGLTKAFGVLGALGAGWVIGTSIYENIVAPLIASNHEAARLRGDLDDMAKKANSQSSEQLDIEIKKADKLIKMKGKGPMIGFAAGFGVPGMGSISHKLHKDEVKSINKDRATLKKAYYRNYEGKPDDQTFSSSGTFMPEALPSSSETITREKVEIEINDKTGRARVNRSGNRSRNLDLVHSGGMP